MTAVDVGALDKLREAVAGSLHHGHDLGGDVADCLFCWDDADALIAGPLAPLLAEARRGRALREAVVEIVRWLETAPSVTAEVETPRRLFAALEAVDKP